MTAASWTIARAASLGLVPLIALALGGCASGAGPFAAPTATLRPVLTPVPHYDSRPNPTDCQFFWAASALPYPGRAGLAWYSDQIVVGRVTAQETHWVGTVITTYSLIRVEERVRGLPVDEMIIAQQGGTIDGCRQEGTLRPFDRDSRLLLFLHASIPITATAPTIYYLAFDTYGMAYVSDDPTDEWTARQLAEVRQILSQPPPPNLSSIWIVPLARAPLAPVPRATPTR